jgi:hypothetical protein
VKVALATFATLAAAVCSSTAFAWGHQGHEMVGAIAEMLNPAVGVKVKNVLGYNLRLAALWPDCVRDVQNQNGTFKFIYNAKFDVPCAVFDTPEGTARMEDYARRNWNNCPHGANDGCLSQYHFADVATQRDHYDRAYSGTSDRDIVSAILAAITVLRGQPAPAPFNIKDEPEALLLLAHLVGDLHQPLHVGAVYLNATGGQIDPDGSGLPVDPETETHGGNLIEDAGQNLHAEWDEIASTLDPASISNEMLTEANGVAVTAGEVTTWPAAWASDTIVASHEAFNGASFTRVDATKPGHWTVTFNDPTTYADIREKLQARQLAKGGARLAQLLSAILP